MLIIDQLIASSYVCFTKLPPRHVKAHLAYGYGPFDQRGLQPSSRQCTKFDIDISTFFTSNTSAARPVCQLVELCQTVLWRISLGSDFLPAAMGI